MNKLKIAFDIEDNWDEENFRNTIKALVWEEKYDIFIITKLSAAEADLVGDSLGLNADNVISALSEDADIITSLDTNRIQIYLTADMDILDLANQQAIDTVSILVNPQIQDLYHLQAKWVSQLIFWIKRLSDVQESNC